MLAVQWKYPWDQRNSLRGVWGHLRCQERLWPPVRVQRVQQIPRGSVLQCKQGTCTWAGEGRAVTQKQPQHHFVNTDAWVFLRNKIQIVRGSEWDTWSEFHIYLVICVHKNDPWTKDVKDVFVGRRAQRPHNSQHIAAGGEILFRGKKSAVLIVLRVTDSIQVPLTFSKD